MIEVTVPDYYGDFRCTADKCPDNCCIGWEIDIDDKTYRKYMSFTCALKSEMDEYITVSEDGSRCFRLTKELRCPFLNEQNLCRIILSEGEDALCDICANHPRFHNCFGNIRRTGAGISCIAAAEPTCSQKAWEHPAGHISRRLPHNILFSAKFQRLCKDSLLH